MIRQQRTIRDSVTLTGWGLHTGNEVVLTIKPAPANSGIKFVRTDLDQEIEVAAKITSVPSESHPTRNTTIGVGESAIYTVEHVLAACYGLNVDNLLIEISANEPPITNAGSCEEFVRAFNEVGYQNQGAPRDVLVIDRAVSYRNGDIEITATPDDCFRVSFTIEYPNKHIGTQFATFEVTPETFEKEISSARTFVLAEDVEGLREEGLIKGGSLENALVFGEDGLVNDTTLRFPNECARHKLLDLVGDLSLLGESIQGHVHAIKSGHSSNLQFVKKLSKLSEMKRKTDSPANGTWDINLIQKILPHRYPFLMVDRILELEDRKRVVGIKNVTINEPFFDGHFPGHPIMPAVLIIEAMAQTGGILLLNTVDNPENYLVYFSRIDKARFRKPVLPGDQLRLELELVALKLRVCKMRGLAYVGSDLVAEADLLASIVAR